VDLSNINMTDAAFSSSISSSIASGITCSSLSAQDASTAACKLRVVPPGTYWLAVSYMGATHILQRLQCNPTCQHLTTASSGVR
jgi:hypothetical protein